MSADRENSCITNVFVADPVAIAAEALRYESESAFSAAFRRTFSVQVGAASQYVGIGQRLT